ncbi:MAG: site-specific DNA-methyltransferase, partial [bacterium]|nr:site-specific DNA-methyltransferase [bacterium]
MNERTRKLYYGDCLDVMRGMIPDASVDLVYLDPPFNSNATYTVLFKTPEGLGDAAQIRAFEDTWHWTAQTEREYEEILKNPYGNSDLAKLTGALLQFLGQNDMMAYLVHMANRLLEIRRVMKDTASIYLHCDPAASHYLKLVMDAVVGTNNFRNEIIWQRTNTHNDAGQFGRIHDVILFYTYSPRYTWNVVTTGYSPEQLKRYKLDENGRLYTGQDMTASRPDSDSGKFNWRGTMPPPSRGWGYTIEQLEKWWADGLILTKKDGTPRMDGLKKYLNEMPGKPLQSIWTDIPRIPNTSQERLGYPTQKPYALLERIIQASSNEDDVVLDPFCGCGTTVHAAEQLKRSWIGIDITHLAINLIRTRLTSAFPGIEIETHGLPASYAGALELARADKHEFELWVLSEIGAMPYKGGRKGADTGIDGYLFFRYLDEARGGTTEEARGLSPLSK